MTDMATLKIVVDANGAIRAVDQFGRATTGASRGADVLKARTTALSTAMGALGGIIAAQAISRFAQLGTEMVRTADQMRALEGRLKLVTNSAVELTLVQDALRASATASRSAYADVVQLYARTAAAATELGRSQADLLRFVELTNMAVKSSGATATEASAAMIQLSQGLGSGVLRGEEFNSIMEQTPALARAMADGLGIPVGALRALANEGKLTAGTVISSVLRMDKEIRGDFATAPTLVSDGWQQLKDAISLTVGEIDKATSASSRFAGILTGIAGFIRSGVELPNNFAQGLGIFAGMGRGGITGGPTAPPQAMGTMAPMTITATAGAATSANAAAVAVSKLDGNLKQLEVTLADADPQVAKSDAALKAFFADLQANADDLAAKLEAGNIAAIKGTGNAEVARVFTEQMQTALARFGSDFLATGLRSVDDLFRSFTQLGREAIGQVFAKSVMDRVGNSAGKALGGFADRAISGVQSLGGSALGVIGLVGGVVAGALSKWSATSKWEAAAEAFNRSARMQEKASAQLASAVASSRDTWLNDFLNYANTESPAAKEIRALTNRRNELAGSAFDIVRQAGSSFSNQLNQLVSRPGFDLGTAASLARRDAGIAQTETGRKALLDFADAMDELAAAFVRNTAAAKEAEAVEKRLAFARQEANLKAFRDSLLLSAQSTLSPTQQLSEARSQYNAIVALARGGDASAIDSLPDTASALLDAARGVFASGTRYADEFNRVRQDLEALITVAQQGQILPATPIDVTDTILDRTEDWIATTREGTAQLVDVQVTGFQSVVDELVEMRAELATVTATLKSKLTEVVEAL